jgi:hypothetical protein
MSGDADAHLSSSGVAAAGGEYRPTVGVEEFPRQNPNDAVLWIESHRAVPPATRSPTELARANAPGKRREGCQYRYRGSGSGSAVVVMSPRQSQQRIVAVSDLTC